MDALTLYSAVAEDTFDLGRRLGRAMPSGTVLALSGDLGLGKTVLAAGVGAGLGVEEEISSPTYIYFNRYQGRLPFYHVDAYRLEGREEEEIALIGIEECFRLDAVAVVEWAELIPDWLPADAVWIELRRRSQGREIEISYDKERQGWIDEALSH